MIEQQKIKQFIEDFLTEFGIEFSIDKNLIYHVKLKDFLANKLGKEIKFTFNRQTASDFGVNHIRPKSKILSTFLNYSLKHGVESYGRLEAKRSLQNIYLDKLPNEIKKIDKGTNFNHAVAFLYKISSTNKISDNSPEKLKYYFFDLISKEIIDSVSEEFHNLKIEDSKFKLNKEEIVNASNIVINRINDEESLIYEEYSNINNDFMKDRKNELEKRNNEFKKGLRANEAKLEKQIKDLENKIYNARSFDKQREYQNQLKEKKNQLEDLKLNNLETAKKHYERIEKEFEMESKNYDFEVSINLQSLICLEYPIKKLLLKNPETNEEQEIIQNLILDNSLHFQCINCKKFGSELRISIDNHFCCEKCSKPFKETFVCSKDKTVKSILTDEILLPVKENQCAYCNSYLEPKYMEKSYETKNICVCKHECDLTGKYTPKIDLIFLEDSKINVLKTYVDTCEHSKKQFLKSDLEKTTGDKKLIAKKYIQTCKKTNLTFSPENFGEKYSKLYENLEDKNIEEIKVKDLLNAISSKKIKYSEDKYYILISYSKFFKDNFILYNKSTKEKQKLYK